VLWNQGVHTDREVLANTDICGYTSWQKCHAKGSRKETKKQNFKVAYSEHF
jgi:hypothetical protein